MPRGHSVYIDDPYGSFVADVRLAYIRATTFGRDGGMNADELSIIEAVHDTLVTLDPHAANVNPQRSARGNYVPVAQRQPKEA